MNEQKTINVFPRRLARRMAKAEIGSNRIKGMHWRLAAAARAARFAKKGGTHAERS